jgi:hypothetical protein
MNVRGLIEHLKYLDPDARVVVFGVGEIEGAGEAFGLVDVENVESLPIKVDFFGSGLHDGVTEPEIDLGRNYHETAIFLGGKK